MPFALEPLIGNNLLSAPIRGNSNKVAMGASTEGRIDEAIMSIPKRSEDGIYDQLSYAPRWVRQSQPVAPEPSATPNAPSAAPVITTDAAGPGITNARPTEPEIGDYNIDLPPPRSRPFEGDVAIKHMRRQLSLDPQGLPK